MITGRCPFTAAALEVTCDDERIVAIRRVDTADRQLPWVLPGLIDLQVNGYAGHDVNGPTASASAVVEITDVLAKAGVTTWVPTVITASEAAITHSLEAVRDARRDPAVARAIPFVHVEGPFLSAEDGPRGAHDATEIRPIDAVEVARWQRVTPVGYVTVSPHEEGAVSEIARIVASGTRVAIGHTHASPRQIVEAVDAGASLSTHLGNGIHPELPRHPNAIWTQLADDRLTAGFIGDGHHLSAEVLTAMVRAKGTARSFLVSDSAALAGSAPGIHETPVGGRVELTADGRLCLPGTTMLAGSGVNLAQVVRFVLTQTPLGVRDVAELACVTPARVLGRSHAYVQVGAPSDLVLLDDAGKVTTVVRGGREL
ncbi:N-acetylglucosamine-6-phosphate deacetylase [Mariniluteicoccus flavus]